MCWARCRWVALLFFVGGCSIDDKDFPGTSVKYFRNDDDTARAVAIDTWGLHVTTNSLDRGVTLGQSHKIYFHAGGQSGVSDDHPSAGSLRIETSKLKPVSSVEGKAWHLGSPMAFIGFSRGIILHANRRVGVALGLSRDAVIDLPTDRSVELFLRSSTGGDGSNCVMSFREREKTESRP